MRVTASKVGLLAECGYWARPEAEWADSTSPAAERGTRFHRAIAEYVARGKAPSIADDIAGEMASAIAWLDARPNDGLVLHAAEMAFAWDPARDTAEQIPAVERDYQASHSRLCGTADLVIWHEESGSLEVYDWKTGDGSRAAPQLRALALMAARTYHVEAVTVAALEVTADGVLTVCREDLDSFALSAIAGELAENLDGIAVASPRPGEWCAKLYCPARAACPAGLEVEALIPSESLVRHQWGLAVQSPDHAAYLFERAKLVAKVADDVLEAVRAYVPPAGFTLSDGRVLAVTEGHTRSAFSVARAKSLLLAKGATAEEIESCSPAAPVRGSLKISKATKSRKKAA